tara:strand:+ start:99 stop:335 length:237 start_codon:yes stop_codon:yes gene_type:complete
MTDFIKDSMDEREEMTPDEGFNICLFDDFASPGEMLTLVAHTESLDEAEKIKKEYEEKVKNGEVYAKHVYIYNPKNIE